MGRLKVEWHEPAAGMFHDTVDWYLSEMGKTAARRFRSGVLDCVRTLAGQPLIGRRGEIVGYKSEHELRVFVEHRSHLILYYVEGDTLHVADILDARMQRRFVWV